VPLGEDEVDDRQDRRDPGREVGVAGHAIGDARIADLLLGPHDPLCHRRLGHEEGPCDLGRREAAEEAQAQRHLRLPRQGRVAAGEDEAEPFVAHRALLSGLVGRGEQQRLRLARVPACLPAQPVQGSAAGGGDDPAGGAGRHTVSGPALDGHGEGVLHGVLSEVDVAEAADEDRHRAPVLRAEDPGDVGSRHGRPAGGGGHRHSVVGC
jgi:hypothetical protein